MDNYIEMKADISNNEIYLRFWVPPTSLNLEHWAFYQHSL
jgi:hypothetical protein